MSRTGLSASGEAHDGRGVGVHAIDAAAADRLRQLRQDAVDLVAHFLRRDVDVLVEQERDDDLRDAFRRRGPQFVDALMVLTASSILLVTSVSICSVPAAPCWTV